MRHLRWMLLLSVLAGFGSRLQPAAAQQPPAIERLTVALWPEYDQPAMLVILRVQLAPGTVLPAEVTLPIPASAGEPLAVAYTTAEGALLNAPYTRQVQGDWALITLTSETLSAQLEYYQPLQISGTQRDFLYEWPGGQDLTSLSYEVQHPVGSQAMTIDPPPQSSAPRPDGLLYSFADLGPVPGTETRRIQLSYARESSALSVDSTGQPAPPVAGSAEPADSGLDVTAWLPVGLGVVGVVLVIATAGLYWRSRRRGSRPPGRERHRPKQSAEPEAGATLDASVVFCHSCGIQAAVTDKFCRQCGTKLRG
jgi:hypothetical protein